MREVKNCKRCHMIFSTYDDAMLCKKCQDIEEETFKLIRDYLYDNPGTSIYDLSAKFNISTKRLGEYLRNDRLQIT